MNKKIPSRTKFLKCHSRIIIKRIQSKRAKLKFGSFGLQSLQTGFISSKCLESARIAINHSLQRKGKIWCRVFPQTPITRKAAETRMGKGKGDISHYSAYINNGSIIFEVKGVSLNIARESLSRGERKLPLKCRFLHYKYWYDEASK